MPKEWHKPKLILKKWYSALYFYFELWYNVCKIALRLRQRNSNGEKICITTFQACLHIRTLTAA